MSFTTLQMGWNPRMSCFHHICFLKIQSFCALGSMYVNLSIWCEYYVRSMYKKMCVYSSLDLADPCFFTSINLFYRLASDDQVIGLARLSRFLLRVEGPTDTYMAPILLLSCIYLVFIKCQDYSSSPLNEMKKKKKTQTISVSKRWDNNLTSFYSDMLIL